ncbi:MAG: hypothetical protein IJ087_19245 [Eggerthellaceae bacterium]|nr:hypothetical protein [Eggerthellaceae bacterium]
MAAQNLTATLDKIAAWVDSAIAPELEYLVPPDEGAVDEIDLEWAHPTVSQAFTPPVERLQDGERQAPSIAVQLTGGADGLRIDRELTIRLLLTIWSPGHFADGRFMRDSDGWRDLFNGLGTMVAAVENAETIAACSVDMASGVEFGFYEIDKEIPDLYPYWIGRVDFKLRRSPQANKRFEALL